MKFVLGGGASVAVYYFVLYSLTEWAGVWYILSACVAWLANWSLNFTIQKYWTFRNRDHATIRQQMIRYFAMAAGFLGITTAGLYALVEWGGLHYLLAQLILTTILSVVSYLVTRRIFATPAA